jgi:hypothetical protein
MEQLKNKISNLPLPVFGTLFLLFTLWIVFYPVLWYDFAYSDEVYWLYKVNNDGFDLLRGFTEQGRFFAGIYCKFVMIFASTISDLRSIRIFTLLGWSVSIAMSFVLLYKMYIQIGVHYQQALLQAITPLFFLICSASMITFIPWNAMMQSYLAFIFAFIAGYQALMYSFNHKIAINMKFLLAVSLQILGLVIALGFYQPLSTWFLLPCFLYFLERKKIDKHLIYTVVIFFIGFLAYFLIFKSILYSFNISAQQRTGIIGFSEIGTKINWLFSDVLPRAAQLNALSDANGFFKILVGVFISCYLVSSNRKNIVHFFKDSIILSIFLILAFLPNILSSENWFTVRTYSTLNTFIFLIFFSSFSYFFLNKKNILAIFVCFPLLFITAQNNLKYNYILPLHAEYTVLKNHLTNSLSRQDSYQSIHFIRSHWSFFINYYTDFYLSVVSDEIGMPSSFTGYAPESYTKQILKELSHSDHYHNIPFVLHETTEDVPYDDVNALIVNISELMRNR